MLKKDIFGDLSIKFGNKFAKNFFLQSQKYENILII